MKKSKFLKVLFTALALVLVSIISVSGTLAYLKKTSNPVVNTFAAANLVPEEPGDDGKPNFRIEESKLTGDPDNYTLDPNEKVDGNNYTVIPGAELPKDPSIVINKLQVEAYLFVEVVDKLPDTITWTMADGWTKLTGVTGPVHGGEVYVYNTELAAQPEAAPAYTISLIKDNKLTVASNYAEDQTTTELKFVSYLAQTTGFTTAAEAWAANFAS